MADRHTQDTPLGPQSGQRTGDPGKLQHLTPEIQSDHKRARGHTHIHTHTSMGLGHVWKLPKCPCWKQLCGPNSLGLPTILTPKRQPLMEVPPHTKGALTLHSQVTRADTPVCLTPVLDLCTLNLSLTSAHSCTRASHCISSHLTSGVSSPSIYTLTHQCPHPDLCPPWNLPHQGTARHTQHSTCRPCCPEAPLPPCPPVHAAITHPHTHLIKGPQTFLCVFYETVCVSARSHACECVCA